MVDFEATDIVTTHKTEGERLLKHHKRPTKLDNGWNWFLTNLLQRLCTSLHIKSFFFSSRHCDQFHGCFHFSQLHSPLLPPIQSTNPSVGCNRLFTFLLLLFDLSTTNSLLFNLCLCLDKFGSSGRFQTWKVPHLMTRHVPRGLPFPSSNHWLPSLAHQSWRWRT